MPENTSGHFGVSGGGDVESWFKDMLCRLEAGQAQLQRAIDELAARLDEQERAMAQAEAIMRRAASPPAAAAHRVSPRRRRGDAPVDRWLRAVKVALIGVLGAGLVLALAAPRHVTRQDCFVQHGGTAAAGPCWRPVAHLDGDGDHDGTPAHRGAP